MYNIVHCLRMGLIVKYCYRNIRYIAKQFICASGSVVEYRLPKARAAGSNPVWRLYNERTVVLVVGYDDTLVQRSFFSLWGLE